jgi:hypothetical protein
MNCQTEVREQILDWLLEEDNAAVRYNTLKYLLGREDASLEDARGEAMKSGPIPAILGKMRAPEYSLKLPEFYKDKYRGLSWQLLILAELGADGRDARIRNYCEYLFASSQERAEGGFSMETSAKLGGGRKGSTIPCLTGNMIFCLCRLGLSGDERVLRAAQWLAERQRHDDGDGVPSDRPACWGNHSCYMGAVKALKGFAEIPPEKRSAAVRRSIERGAEFLLKHHVYKQSHDLSKPMKPGWTKFSFPLMYQTDALEMLLILGRLGIRDERMREAAQLVESKRDERGRWENTAPLAGKFLVEIEPKGQSKWITLRALEALKYCHG